MKKIISVNIVLACLVMLLAACGGQGEKIRDLEATILSEEVLPEELKSIVDEKKAQPFQFTYSDSEYLYICIGYGAKDAGGYSIALNDLYLTESAVYIDTTLLGPGQNAKNGKTTTYPYIVVRTELLSQPVIFE